MVVAYFIKVRKKLVKKVQTLSKLPTIGHLEGICHTFIDKDANPNIANKVVVMNKGKIEEFGSTKEVFSNPSSTYTKTLIRAIPTVTDEEDAIKP